MPKLFANKTVELEKARLTPVSPGNAYTLGEEIAELSPWSTLSISPRDLTRYLTCPDPANRRYTILVDDEIAGAVAIRSPWLRGPYLELLVVLPDFQGHGIGHEFLEWMEREARDGNNSQNLWVAASSFNTKAVDFYTAHGFETIANLPGLVREDFDEILLRKRL